MTTTSSSWRLIWMIMGGLLAWGLLLGLGTFLVPGRLPVVRALIVFGCTALFIAFWGLMLWLRNARLEREEP